MTVVLVIAYMLGGVTMETHSSWDACQMARTEIRILTKGDVKWTYCWQPTPRSEKTLRRPLRRRIASADRLCGVSCARRA